MAAQTKTKQDLAVEFINWVRTQQHADLTRLVGEEVGEQLAQFFLAYARNLIAKDPARVLENTSSLMLMGYLIAKNEEATVKTQGTQAPGKA